MEHAHKVDVPLSHHVDVDRATHFLLRELDCDSWYVACHQEHRFVFRLSHQGEDRYALCFECTPPVDKGIYHGSKAWALSIIPLRGVEDLTEQMVHRISAAFAAGEHEQDPGGSNPNSRTASHRVGS